MVPFNASISSNQQVHGKLPFNLFVRLLSRIYTPDTLFAEEYITVDTLQLDLLETHNSWIKRDFNFYERKEMSFFLFVDLLLSFTYLLR
jgi:hypothetical protein